ncbi:MAG: hypothetical protein JWM87_319 [Candidatus Eremiobacteraeota bacterium]|nr:hypothetical protein [Candidatus Eremiobacteraeota bacterium]
MGSLVNVLIFVLWVVVAFFVLRYAAQRYFHEPRRADVAALGAAAAFAVGLLWPSSFHSGGQPAPAFTPSTVGALVIGSNPPRGGRDVSAGCRSAGEPLAKATVGSVDFLRSDEHQSTIVSDGGQLDGKLQYVIEGWAAEPNLDRPASGACLVIDGKVDPTAKAYVNIARPDVATAYNRAQLSRAGYVITIAAGSLPAGKHTIQVLARTGAVPAGILPRTLNVTVR